MSTLLAPNGFRAVFSQWDPAALGAVQCTLHIPLWSLPLYIDPPKVWALCKRSTWKLAEQSGHVSCKKFQKVILVGSLVFFDIYRELGQILFPVCFTLLFLGKQKSLSKHVWSNVIQNCGLGEFLEGSFRREDRLRKGVIWGWFFYCLILFKVGLERGELELEGGRQYTALHTVDSFLKKQVP